jgi:hypothetical protein
MKNTYSIEMTDTFGGEANYCWVNRFTVRAKSIQSAMSIIARETGLRTRKAFGDNDFARYNAVGACVCFFVEFEIEA